MYIYLNGRADIDDVETVRAYEVAEAAMRLYHPRAYIFNPCEYLRRFSEEERTNKKQKLWKILRCGFFTHMVLLEDWWLWSSSRLSLAELADGWDYHRPKPEIIPVTEEMEHDGREYLSRLAKAEHQSQRNNQ